MAGHIYISSVPHAHKHRLDGHIEYVGRCNKHYNLASSVFANPYRLSRDTPAARARLMELYRRYLWGRLKNKDLAFVARLDFLIGILETTDIYLLCWCKTAEDSPILCHADIVKRALLWRRAPQSS